MLGNNFNKQRDKRYYNKFESLLTPNFDLSEKIDKLVYQVRQILALFRNLITLILG